MLEKNKCFKMTEKSNDIVACNYDQLSECVFLQNILPLTLKQFVLLIFFSFSCSSLRHFYFGDVLSSHSGLTFLNVMVFLFSLFASL